MRANRRLFGHAVAASAVLLSAAVPSGSAVAQTSGPLPNITVPVTIPAASGGQGTGGVTSGGWFRTPDSGPPGTTIVFSSIAPCPIIHPVTKEPLPNAAGEVDLFLRSPYRSFAKTTMPVRVDGSWSGSLSIPLDTAPGEYWLSAGCHSGRSPLEKYVKEYDGGEPRAFVITEPSPALAPIIVVSELIAGLSLPASQRLALDAVLQRAATSIIQAGA